VARSVEGVGEATVLSESDGVATLSFRAAPDLRPRLARALVQNGVDLLRIDRGAARLESIFLQLTKDKGPLQ
jgi:ABC-2 type transport system ATP-binding protein